MLDTNRLCVLQATDLTTCMNCPRKRLSLFSDLNLEELEALNRNRYEVDYQAGETIYKEGTKPPGLICLNSGKVKISRQNANGVEQIVALKKPVDFMDASVCIIEKNDFFKIIANNSVLAFKLIRFFASELNKAELRMVNLTQKHLRARLADALLMVNEVYGSCPVKRSLNLSLKRSDLAALSNMTTANAIRVLSSFSKEKIIEVNQRDICLKDLKSLREISDFGR